MGYEKQLFIKGVTEDITCKLCEKVMENAVQCNKCEIWFCQSCLDNSCLHPEQGCVHEYKEVNKFMKSKIEEMMVKCKYHTSGCVKILKVSQVDKHQYVCDFATFVCNTKECYGKMTKKSVEYHVKSCPYSVIICNICNKKMKKQDAQVHSCVTWLFSVIENLEIKNKIQQEEIIEFRQNQNDVIKSNNHAFNKMKEKISQLENEKKDLENKNQELIRNYEKIKQQSNMDLINKINDFQQNAEQKLNHLWVKSDEQFELFNKRTSERIKALILNSQKNLEEFNMKVYADSFDLVTLPKDVKFQDKSPIKLIEKEKKIRSPKLSIHEIK